jgi:hypothetical protein
MGKFDSIYYSIIVSIDFMYNKKSNYMANKEKTMRVKERERERERKKVETGI